MSWLFKSLQSKDEVNDIHSQSSSTEESQPSKSPSSSTLIVGIRNDLAELGGSLKTGLSLLSNKFSSTLFQFQYEVGEEEEAINDVNFNRVPGITREAVKFVDEISTRIEFWNEFPLQLPSDFRMSEVQQEHASTIERLVPRLTQLRGQLHRYMGDEQFWMLYFIFLLPRLNQHDYEILSSTQIVETRDELLRMLENKRTTEGSDNTEMATSGGNEESGAEERFTSSQKKVSQITDATEGLVFDDEGDIKPWLKEKIMDTGLSSVDKQKRLQQDDAVSFSDLEYSDDDLSTKFSASRQRQATISPSPSTSSDWVQLNESAQTHGRSHRARQSTSDAESSDWLKVDESD